MWIESYLKGFVRVVFKQAYIKSSGYFLEIKKTSLSVIERLKLTLKYQNKA